MSMKLFCGSSYRDLGERIANHIGIPLGEISLDNFADGEVNIFVGESVRNCECVIIQSTINVGKMVNDIFMELLIIIDALKRGSASKVVVVMPYFGYSRADRKDYSRAPISAKVVASSPRHRM